MKRNHSLKVTLNRIVILPLIILSLLLILLAGIFIFTSISKETQYGLGNLSHTLSSLCDLTGKGNYHLEDGILMKGSSVLNSSIVDQIKEISGADATIFYGEVRKLTTIRNGNGKRIIGTSIDKEIADTVLTQGKHYFSNHVPINNIYYYGYYTPLQNKDHSIIGMVFVGKPRELLMKTIRQMILSVCLLAAVIIGITLFVVLRFTRKITFSLNQTKEFLGSVAQGDITCKIDPYVLSRQDEFGEMGRFSVMLQESITELIGSDPLTGLANRRKAKGFLNHTFRNYENHQLPFCLAMGDIDDFKNINDTYGHVAGDQLLRDLADVFQQKVANKGLVARWGGEEFLFILENFHLSEAVQFFEELSDAVRTQPTMYQGQKISVTMTFGVSECGADNNTESIIECADQFLYYGKQHGKDRVISNGHG